MICLRVVYFLATSCDASSSPFVGAPVLFLSRRIRDGVGLHHFSQVGEEQL